MKVTYHGQADYIISSDNSPRYYDHVSRTMGLPSSDLDEFYRFFRISGMGEYLCLPFLLLSLILSQAIAVEV
jgi:Tannase and feruloyl esterase